MVNALKQKQMLTELLSKKIASPFVVELGMSYGNPSMESAIANLKAQHCNKILVFPLYPQYASSSTAASLDAIWKVLLHPNFVDQVGIKCGVIGGGSCCGGLCWNKCWGCSGNGCGSVRWSISGGSCRGGLCWNE